MYDLGVFSIVTSTAPPQNAGWADSPVALPCRQEGPHERTQVSVHPVCESTPDPPPATHTGNFPATTASPQILTRLKPFVVMVFALFRFTEVKTTHSKFHLFLAHNSMDFDKCTEPRSHCNNQDVKHLHPPEGSLLPACSQPLLPPWPQGGRNYACSLTSSFASREPHKCNHGVRSVSLPLADCHRGLSRDAACLDRWFPLLAG